MERKRPRRTRERILELALRLFNDLGEPNVTTSAIASELNISPGNLYYHFRNKDDIVAALFERYEHEIDRLLELPEERGAGFEDAWLFLHLLFEIVWRHRFVYRDLNDLIARSRRLETRMRAILERKTRAIRDLCVSLASVRGAAPAAREFDALAANMVVVTSYWLSYEYVNNARRFGDPAYQSAAMARGAYQVLAMLAPYLGERDRALLAKLADEYLRPDNRPGRP